MNFEDLKNPEFQEKLMSAKSAADLVELAKAQGVELTDEQLDAVAGGEQQNLWEQTHDDDCANFNVCWTLGFSS